jgi:hypothetical protein
VQARQHIANHRDPPVADVQRPGWIDAGKFNLDFLSMADVELGIRTGIDDAKLLEIKFRREREI